MTGETGALVSPKDLSGVRVGARLGTSGGAPRRGKGFVTMLGLVALGLGSVEASARLLAPRAGAVPVDFLVQPDPGAPHRLVPGIDRIFQVEGHAARVRTGPHGRVGDPPADADRRIAVVGDSRAMGLWASEYGRSMMGLAQRGLAPWNVAIDNWAVPGYGLVEIEMRLPEVLAEGPDAVVLVASCADDLAETWLATHGSGERLRRVRHGRLEPDRRGCDLPLEVRFGRPLRGLGLADAWLSRVSLGYRLLRGELDDAGGEPLGSRSFGLPGFWCQSDAGPIGAEAIQEAQAALLRMRRACGRSGARFAVVAVPSREQVRAPELTGEGWDARRPQRCLVRAAEEAGAPVLDLLPALRAAAARSKEPLYFARDPNLTDAGHAACAEEVTPFLRSLVPERRAARR